ncbi:hypothetical protein Q5O24_12845 [Eubacteriaceae bacterium ES3]|nr:hypothetical protein Q5O24_12845 [Eubacteriaceae bacterium ES3]
MRIYIAASWKHQHAVEMLTDLLEERSHKVLSWIREGRPEEAFLSQKELTHFIESDEGLRVFDFCVSSVKSADLLIYIGPSGCDAWAEIGTAYGSQIPIFGLKAKAEQVGLMRHMIKNWFSSIAELLQGVEAIEKELFTRR